MTRVPISSKDFDEGGRAAIVREIDATAADAHTAATFEEALHQHAVYARVMIGAHQSALSYVPDGDFHAAIHTHSFSKKYERYNTYDVMPTGEGIWGVVVEQKIPMRMTEKELLSHPRWRNFGDMKDARGLEHPPMPGWLVVPILRRGGGFLGVLQVEEDLPQAARVAHERIRHIGRHIGDQLECLARGARRERLHRIAEVFA